MYGVHGVHGVTFLGGTGTTIHVNYNIYHTVLFLFSLGEKIAVDDVCLRMYEDQITVLLGHNGAGKTSLMSVLSGFYSPTSGTAVVNGYDIKTSMDGVRSSLSK